MSLVEFTNIRDQESMARQIKGSKIVFIDGAGHEIYVDKAKECFVELEAFIENVNKK
jgi:pimeloyl-ACP methyl ester carboxylesterase